MDGALKKLDVPVAALFSTLGRTAARGLETLLIAQWAQEFYADLVANIKNGDTRMFNGEKWDPATWPTEAKGVGLTEAPRGALAHWIVIKDGKIENYQLVVPSTWNASPRDPQGPAVRLRVRPASERRWRTRSSRWRSCARSTRSIPASPAPSTSTTKRAGACPPAQTF